MPVLKANTITNAKFGSTEIRAVYKGSVPIWTASSLVSGKPCPTGAFRGREMGTGVEVYPVYFTYDIDVIQWNGKEPTVGDSFTPNLDLRPSVNKSPSGDLVYTQSYVWYLGKRTEEGRSIYSYRIRSSDHPTVVPAPEKYNYTLTINGIVSDVAEADLHYP